MRAALQYAFIFVATVGLASLILSMPARAPGPSRLLKVYLAILIAFEAVVLYRVHALHEPLHAVVDFVAQPKDAAFTSLFTCFIGLLIAARLAPLLAPPLSSGAWIACALAHVVEAFWVLPFALRDGALPATLAAFRPAHGAAAFIVFMVAFNAYLFACVAMMAMCQIEGQPPQRAAPAGAAPAALQAKKVE
jgi:hypothetical protein